MVRPKLRQTLVGVVLATLLIAVLDLRYTDHTSQATTHLLSGHYHQQESLAAVRELLLSNPTSHHPPAGVLLPDWEVLLLLPLPAAQPPVPLNCLFQDGATSPAVPAGVAAFRCTVPATLRRLSRQRVLYSPTLLSPTSVPATRRPPAMLRWNRLVFESLSTEHDVILLAKGINRRPGGRRSLASLRCVFVADDDTVVATTNVTSSVQEVFRCPHPSPLPSPRRHLTVTLGGGAAPPLPSLATYTQPPRGGTPARRRRYATCACTMVYNAAKYVREWVMYYSAVGVEWFVLYDNGSDDELELTVARLVGDGYNIITRWWPWPKTQEAGFSHCAAAYRDVCAWMLFVDVDEFVFSPTWSTSTESSPTMLQSLLPTDPSVGQVTLSCLEFGPSGLREHPSDGVTQGYTCRRAAEQRHKAVVRLEAVDSSLMNAVHHFAMAEGFATRRVALSEAVVNHYKYQVWGEFKAKFRRRVSAYVVDWKVKVNLGSNDRTPGLGYEAVEPEDWAGRFCEKNDTRLREVSRRWFRVAGEESKMAWEE